MPDCQRCGCHGTRGRLPEVGSPPRGGVLCCVVHGPRRPRRGLAWGGHGGRSDRDLRLRLRWTHRGPRRHRPAPARVGALPRRHRPPAVRPQADRRGARVRPRVPRPPRRPGRQALVIACNSASAAVLRDARERYPVPGGRGDLPGHPSRGRRQPDRPDRRHLHPRHRGVDGLRRRLRRRPARRPAPPRPAPASSSSSRPASRAGRTCSRWPTSTSTRWSSEGIDTLILGCTHYPLLTAVIAYVMGDQVTLVSSAEETAKDVYRTLVRRGLERDPDLGPPTHQFLTTGEPGGVPADRPPLPRPRAAVRADQFAWVRASA